MTGLARKISDRVIQIFYPKGCSAADETSIFMEGENWKSDGLRAAQKLMKSSTLGHTSLVGNTRKGISNPFIINTDLIFTGCPTKFWLVYVAVTDLVSVPDSDHSDLVSVSDLSLRFNIKFSFQILQFLI